MPFTTDLHLWATGEAAGLIGVFLCIINVRMRFLLTSSSLFLLRNLSVEILGFHLSFTL